MVGGGGCLLAFGAPEAVESEELAAAALTSCGTNSFLHRCTVKGMETRRAVCRHPLCFSFSIIITFLQIQQQKQ